MLLVCLVGLSAVARATQLDYTGDDRIISQTWRLAFTVPPGWEDTFCVRMPYPDYSMVGRWATYTTDSLGVDVDCEDFGHMYYEFHHYNDGYSNQGVWIKVFDPPGPVEFTLWITQSVTLNLPGHDYALEHFTNNGWMEGTDVVDVNSPTVQSVLQEALALQGDWHTRGFWSESEQVVNWMCENMTWVDDNRFEPLPASYILQQSVRRGDCDAWAHAACALLLKAGIPARVVMVGTTLSCNATPFCFDNTVQHLCLSYWDGYGWITIDPDCSSGFTFISRVVLGADQDSKGVRIETYPEHLVYNIYNAGCSYEDGWQTGYLNLMGDRCSSYFTDILEHYEKPDSQSTTGSEPKNNIIPRTVTAVSDHVPECRNRLFVNHPNPFNPVTIFTFHVERQGRIRLDVYSVDGSYVETVSDRFMKRGVQTITWHAEGLSSGIYLVRIRSDTMDATRKVVILR